MRVLVIGGGIGGLTAAIALRARGMDVAVYERAPALAEVGAGISLWPNATKALRKLGLGEPLDAASCEIEFSGVRRSDGTILSRASLVEMKRRFGGGVVMLHRAALLGLLTDSLGPDVIRPGQECVGIEETSGGVTARFASGKTAQGDVLIGADGLRSAVRVFLGHSDAPRYSGYTCWRAVVPFDHSAIVGGETFGCGQRFGFLPMVGGRVYWYATANAQEGGSDPVEGRQAHLLSLFKGWHAPVEALIEAAGPNILRHDLYDREPLTSWGRGSVTLLGDAAHPMTPNLGQGACQGIEDALVLARSLATAPSVPEALRAYEQARIPRTSTVVVASRRVGTIGQTGNPLLCRLRDTALRLTPASVTYRSMASVLGYEGHLAG